MGLDLHGCRIPVALLFDGDRNSSMVTDTDQSDRNKTSAGKFCGHSNLGESEREKTTTSSPVTVLIS
jgi:hypothetical protein